MLRICCPKVGGGVSPPPVGPYKSISTWSSHLGPTHPSPVFIKEMNKEARFYTENGGTHLTDGEFPRFVEFGHFKMYFMPPAPSKNPSPPPEFIFRIRNLR
ncbi:hypothetical protein CDAR_120181 [Caerostris darwini]|uniref:Uncharacterized protein n=1 Tax=Caerostris darwini TaxID=1538125 RepID=A0AAV4UQH0_9ARAC|nr:hypothetical protein CDAR_120181 [Caerostris darwini]